LLAFRGETRGGGAYAAVVQAHVPSVVFPARTLDVEGSDASVHGPPPRLVLVGLDACGERTPNLLPVELPRERTAGGWRFLSIPDGARLVLEGLGPDGRELTRELRAGTMRVSWP
jgi:hypothetical protein